MPERCKICGNTERLHQCEECEGWFCEQHITYAPNPLAEDVYNDDTPVWMCVECRVESTNAI